MSMHFSLAALGTLLVAASLSVPAVAADESAFQNAVGVCNGALPGFEGALRKRPLGIANEGTSNAIVSCSPAIQQFSTTGNTITAVSLGNSTNTLVAVSCTFIDGTSPKVLGAITPVYYTKNIAMGPNEGGMVRWEATEFGLTKFSIVASFSCSLPPGVEILAVATLFTRP